MVATVSGTARTDLITYSDLLWQLALQPGTPLENPRSADLNSALELLINQRLILQEAEKLPTIAPTEKEIQTALAELVKQFGSRAELEDRMRRVGLTSEQLNEIQRERIEIDKYLNFRFRSFIVISDKEIADYYRDVYVPNLKRRQPGRIVPKLEDVRQTIERELTEARVESEMDAFLERARETAEVTILNPV